MGLLDGLMGGGEQQQSFREFADRYSQGAPYDGGNLVMKAALAGIAAMAARRMMGGGSGAGGLGGILG